MWSYLNGTGFVQFWLMLSFISEKRDSHTVFMGEFEKTFQRDISRISKTFQVIYYDKIKLATSIAYYITVLKLDK
ncbi:hypothetical protein Stok01_02604 [Sulfurisphaera tokodaii]|uniref:hypothetical protein n=1 Tax=Sulfurisphaera tokodaii TaxID=111955 RepID=UPI00000650E8|nr:hypothetical protein [Sulfurisphaera tokodaii]